MKNLLCGLYGTAVFSLCFFACSKNSSKNPPNDNASMTLSEAVVKRGQPIVASASQGISSNFTVRWTVTPSTAAYITPANDQAMLLIATPGTYRVTATDAGPDSVIHDSSSATVTVTDGVYTPDQNSFDTLSLAGDKVTLMPVADSDSTFAFLAKSEKSYDCFPNFIYSIDEDLNGGSGIAIRFFDVVSGAVNGNCNGTKNPAASLLFTGVGGRLSVGNYPLSVMINNMVYHGSVAVTNTDYIFTWNDESEVIISPKLIKKKQGR